MSPHLAAAGAVWEDGPAAGGWIAERLAPFGPALGHAVPLGYAAYAVVRPPADHLEPDPGYVPTLDALLDALGRFTGEQPVHCGLWDGWGFLYAADEDPRTAPGMSAGVTWAETDRPTQAEVDRALAEAREELAADRVRRPDAEPLELPHRRYHLWTGPLRSVTALRHQPHHPPSLVWPEDRSWFVGVPIFTKEIAVGATVETVDALVADPRLDARLATPDDVLDSDD